MMLASLTKPRKVAASLSYRVAMRRHCLSKEALDAPSQAIGDAIVAVLMLSMSSWRDDRLAALVKDHVVELVGVVGAVGNDLAGGEAGNQTARRRHVVLLAGSDLKPDRQTKGIYDSMELGAEAAA